MSDPPTGRPAPRWIGPALLAATAAGAPQHEAELPRPTPRQLAWSELELCAFVHFNMNTFTGREWGLGTEDPSTFAPTALDCRQWVAVAKAAGMRGIVLTAKHHDGFCLWPSALTEHDVASSSWRDGRGDVLRELSDACREGGIGFGVYLSPWDRQHPAYGTERYDDVFVGELEEVLGAYGPVFEVWFDGACGEGPGGKRQVYDWERYRATVRRLQPDAVMFSDVGPDLRWVGNERGYAGDPCWATLSPEGYEPGTNAPPTEALEHGEEDGTHWIPPECDVSIRPGWYYHPEEDERVKTLEELLEIWYASVGRGAGLLLNLPVDRRGLVHENDAARLVELREELDRIFALDVLHGREVRATAGGTAPTLTVELDRPTRVDHVVLREAIEHGQRVRRFSVTARVDGEERTLAEGTTIGRKRVLRVPAVECEALSLRVEDALATPVLASFEAYGAR